MRPPQFAGEDKKVTLAKVPEAVASMRPPQFAGEDLGDAAGVAAAVHASMRPPQFAGEDFVAVIRNADQAPLQ